MGEFDSNVKKIKPGIQASESRGTTIMLAKSSRLYSEKDLWPGRWGAEQEACDSLVLFASADGTVVPMRELDLAPQRALTRRLCHGRHLTTYVGCVFTRRQRDGKVFRFETMSRTILGVQELVHVG